MNPNQPSENFPASHVNQPFQPYPLQPGVPPPTPGLIPPTPTIKLQYPWKWIIPLTVSVILFLAAASFGVWAFMSRQDYKNNSDKKVANAVTLAIQQESSRKDKEFIEREKAPFKIYQGPAAYGSLSVSYPKTWAAYVVETTRSQNPVDGYFHPSFVPNVMGGTAFALRIQVTNQTFDQEMKQFEAGVKTGKVKVSPYIPKAAPSITGARVNGEISLGQSGSMVLIPLRDKTVKISANAQQFVSDFDNIILENLKFVP